MRQGVCRSWQEFSNASDKVSKMRGYCSIQILTKQRSKTSHQLTLKICYCERWSGMTLKASVMSFPSHAPNPSWLDHLKKSRLLLLATREDCRVFFLRQHRPARNTWTKPVVTNKGSIWMIWQVWSDAGTLTVVEGCFVFISPILQDGYF